MKNAHMITCRDIKNNTQKVPINKLKFRPSVYGVLLKNNKILLSPQWDGYDFPGGGMEIGETIPEALKREFWEETGITIKPKTLMTVEEDFFVAPFNNGYFHTILIYYLCEYVTGEISTQGFGEDEKSYAQKAQWIDINKINKLKFYNPVDSVSIIKQAKNFLSTSTQVI